MSLQSFQENRRNPWLYSLVAVTWILATDIVYVAWIRQTKFVFLFFSLSSVGLCCMSVFWLLYAMRFRRIEQPRFTLPATFRFKIRRNLEAALTDLESFINYNTDAVILFDEKNTVIKVNPAFETMFQTPGSRVLGKAVFDLPIIPENQHPLIYSLVGNILSGNCVLGEAVNFQTSTGNQLHTLLSLFPLLIPSGPKSGWCATVHNISERKHNELRLLQSEKLAAVGQLAAGIAHEIKNPLTTVMGFIELMKSSSQEKQEQYAEIMLEELHRIADIVNEMLALAKPNSDSASPVRIDEILNSVLQLLEPEAMLRDVELSLCAGRSNSSVPSKPRQENCVDENTSSAWSTEPVVLGYDSRLKQLLINLIRNGMDALNKNPRRVSASFYCGNGDVTIEIRDTGAGLTPEQIERLGEPFFTTKAGGTGLGLFVCHQIVDQHHGRLEFNSDLGHGTVVRVILPRYRTEQIAAMGEGQ